MTVVKEYCNSWVYGSRAMVESRIDCPNSRNNMRCDGYQGCYRSKITAGSTVGAYFGCEGEASCEFLRFSSINKRDVMLSPCRRSLQTFLIHGN